MFTSTNDVELVILTFWSFSPAVTVLFKVLLNKLVKIQLHQNLQGKKKKSWKSKVEIMELVNRTDNISVPLLVNISFSRTLNVEAAEYKERIQSETVSTLQLSFPIAITSIFLLTALDSHRTHLHFCPTTHLSASRANQKRAQATPAEWKPVCQQQPAGWKTKDLQGGAADVERETKLLQRRFVLKKQKLNHV